MTIGELRALPVGRGQIGEVRYLPVGVAPRGRGRGNVGRDVSASIARIGVKLPMVGQHQESKGVENMAREELDSLKPDISENPWVRNDVKRNKLLEKMKSFVPRPDGGDDLASLDVADSERNTVQREHLKRELDEVLRGIRQMGGVGAIAREREGGSGSAEETDPDRRQAEKLWKKSTKKDENKLQKAESPAEVEAAFAALVSECGTASVAAATGGNTNNTSSEAEPTNEEEEEDQKIRSALETDCEDDKDVESEMDIEGADDNDDDDDDDDDEAYISITAL